MTKPQGNPEDWPVQEPPEDTSSPDEGVEPEEPGVSDTPPDAEVEERDTGDKHRLRRD